MKSCLFVFDDTADIDSSAKFCKRHLYDKIYLCPITTNFLHIDSAHKEFKRIVSSLVSIIPFSQKFNEKAFSIKDEYIHFISGFADKGIFNGANIKEYFRHPFKPFSFWWFSLVAEKNTLKTGSFHILVKFLTIIDLKNNLDVSEIILDIDDHQLSQVLITNLKRLSSRCINLRGDNVKLKDIFRSKLFALSFLLKAVYQFILIFLIRMPFSKLMMADINPRKEVFRDCKNLIITYFPNIDEKQFSIGKYINKYYGPFQSALENKDKEGIVWLAMTVPSNNYSWKESIQLGKRINSMGYKFVFYEEWLYVKDTLEILFLYLYLSFKFFMRIPSISKHFIYPGYNSNVWLLFKRDWYDSFCGGILIQNIIYYTCFKNILCQLKNNAIIYYLAEMQAWEKALSIANQGNKDTKLIGVQHASVKPLHLSYFNDPAELRSGNHIISMPRPDYLACAGKTTLNLLKGNGWDGKELILWGAARYQNYKKYLDMEPSWGKRKNTVVAALSIHKEETKEVLFYIYQAFRNHSNYNIIIKGHYSCPISPLLKELNIRLNENIFSISSLPLSELLEDAKVLIVTSSAASIEAIACQCPVIIPRLCSVVDMSPLSTISNLAIYVDNPYELLQQTEKIINAKESPIDPEMSKEFVKNYFEFLDSEEDFIRRLPF